MSLVTQTPDDSVRIDDADRMTGNAGAFFTRAGAISQRTVGVGRLRRKARQSGNLCRADEGDVLRIEEDDLPEVGEAVLGQRRQKRIPP